MATKDAQSGHRLSLSPPPGLTDPSTETCVPGSWAGPAVPEGPRGSRIPQEPGQRRGRPGSLTPHTADTGASSGSGAAREAVVSREAFPGPRPRPRSPTPAPQPRPRPRSPDPGPAAPTPAPQPDPGPAAPTPAPRPRLRPRGPDPGPAAPTPAPRPRPRPRGPDPGPAAPTPAPRPRPRPRGPDPGPAARPRPRGLGPAAPTPAPRKAAAHGARGPQTRPQGTPDPAAGPTSRRTGGSAHRGRGRPRPHGPRSRASGGSPRSRCGHGGGRVAEPRAGTPGGGSTSARRLRPRLLARVRGRNRKLRAHPPRPAPERVPRRLRPLGGGFRARPGRGLRWGRRPRPREAVYSPTAQVPPACPRVRRSGADPGWPRPTRPTRAAHSPARTGRQRTRAPRERGLRPDGPAARTRARRPRDSVRSAADLWHGPSHPTAGPRELPRPRAARTQPGRGPGAVLSPREAGLVSGLRGCGFPQTAARGTPPPRFPAPGPRRPDSDPGIRPLPRLAGTLRTGGSAHPGGR
ncbi:basic proline-rich protein-like [Mustela lutreola]|uniref:basic proline-rich protein-like n=1 Tax=Mustela lutreola TaxID=9666 RepID=UPI00279784B8|nr:basic proline-rich protein-like [Mustela lutreola]